MKKNDLTIQDDELALPLLAEIKMLCEKHRLRIIVLDDDPTGTQTTHDLPVLTDWSEPAIMKSLQEPVAGFFILTNTRSLPEKDAVFINKQIAGRIKKAAAGAGFRILLISRGDSTLRGHFPAELWALKEGLNENVTGYILMPYFKEGNRFTINNIHYLQEKEQLVPVAKSDYAKDPVFGFTHSDLRYYIEEKSKNTIDHASVKSISIDQLNKGVKVVEGLLEEIGQNEFVVVNGACAYHAAVFALALIRQQVKNKQFLVRCAASLVQALFGISGLKLLHPSTIVANNANGGLIIVGSYISRSSEQLQHLLANSPVHSIEVKKETALIADEVNQLIAAGKSLVLYTSRNLIASGDSLEVGNMISQWLVTIVKQLTVQPSFIIAKGGITSSDIATKALGIKKAIVAGQLLPGIPVWRQGEEAMFPGMPYIIFPGNVGTTDYLTRMYKMLNEVPVKK